MAEVSRLPGHVLLEAVSSLTRLPGGHAVPVDVATQAVLEVFPGSPLVLGPVDYLSLVNALGRNNIVGGAAYDALIAATAKAAGAHLLSRDRRAERTYRAIGVDYELLD